MGQQGSALPHEVQAPPAQSAGSPHVGRRDVGLREQTTTEAPGHRLRVALVVGGLTAVAGVQGDGE